MDSRRKAAALRTRTAILDVVQELFLTRGYSATTIALIAETADVSVEAIYKNFGASLVSSEPSGSGG